MSVTITKTSNVPNEDAPILTQVISVTPEPHVKPEKPDANDRDSRSRLRGHCLRGHKGHQGWTRQLLEVQRGQQAVVV